MQSRVGGLSARAVSLGPAAVCSRERAGHSPDYRDGRPLVFYTGSYRSLEARVVDDSLFT